MGHLADGLLQVGPRPIQHLPKAVRFVPVGRVAGRDAPLAVGDHQIHGTAGAGQDLGDLEVAAVLGVQHRAGHHMPPLGSRIRATRLRSYMNRCSLAAPSWAATCWMASVRWTALALYCSPVSPYAVTSYRPARGVFGEWMVTVKP